MRKVEQIMVSMLAQGEEGKASASTVVRYSASASASEVELQVYLFGNLIAGYVHCTDRLTIRDAGYPSATTKSRLNALLYRFAPGYSIVQHDFDWYLVTPVGSRLPWQGFATFRDGERIQRHVA